MQFTINTITASMALLSTVSVAAPLKRETASKIVTLQLGNDESGTTKDVTFNTPQLFTAPFIPDVTTISIIENFGFCTIFDKANKVIGTVSISEADFKAGKTAKDLEFATPVQIQSFFCAADSTTKPIPATGSVQVPTENTKQGVPAPAPVVNTVSAPVDNEQQSGTVRIQVSGGSEEARQFVIPTNGDATDIVEVDNTLEVSIIEGTAECTLYDVASKAVGTVSNAKDATFKSSDKIKIATVQCAAN
jgi:hypothetical protein